ncbi:MAG TPA: sulfatase-like hydrolase/transferase [Thermoanaerobaculia bacterium]|nr:sulfatase-like hydrolase/transferase [Thermoanaerobaculia bacterium]
MRVLGRALGGLALLSGLLLAAEPPGAARARSEPAAAADAHRGLDVLLITIDTLRADAPGFGGNTRGTTPVLDRLAARGRVFTNAHAHNVVTLPSHTNILTGLYPYQHGVRDNSGFRLPPSIPTLATVLHGAGYSTGAFVGAYPLDSQFGLGRGFDVYDDHYPKGSKPTEFVLPERRGDKVVALALAWWRERRGKRRFMWVHLFDPHAPYTPPEPFASRFADNPYLGEVAAADSYLAPLLDPFLAGQEPPALVVVTADHGESLGEHGELTHGLFAYEATLHVPLLLWGPGVAPGRDGAPVRHVDIFPTVLDAAGIAGVAAPLSGKAAPELARPGRSLLPARPEGAGARTGGGTAAPSYFEALSANLNRGWAPLRGVVRGGAKLIALPLPELYELPRDPGETRNLIGSERDLARSLRTLLPSEQAHPLAHSAVAGTQEAERLLRSLGYLSARGSDTGSGAGSGTAPGRGGYGPQDDPKNLIGLDRLMHQAIDLYSRGRVDEAVAVARRIVEARPAMPLGHTLLAQALLQGEHKDEALAVMRQAREKGVATDDLLRQLGLTLAETGRAEEALQVLRPLAGGGEPSSLNALALALSDAGRQQEATAVLDQVLKADPGNPTAYEQQALVALRLGRWAEARQRAERALQLNAELPLAWNDLGVALFQLHEPAAALDAWQRAVDLDPRLIDALWNLGTKGAEQGRREQARRALARFIELAPAERYRDDLRKARELLRQLGDSG